MVSILSVGGYFVGANGGCQTPCLVISACAVAETALASTPPLSCRCYVVGAATRGEVGECCRLAPGAALLLLPHTWHRVTLAAVGSSLLRCRRSDDGMCKSMQAGIAETDFK